MVNNTNNEANLGCFLQLLFILGFFNPAWWLVFAIWILALTAISKYTKFSLSNSSISQKNLPDNIGDILYNLSNGIIKDAINHERFYPGQKVYFCHLHQLAYHENTWIELGYKCKECRSNIHTKLYLLPTEDEDNFGINQTEKIKLARIKKDYCPSSYQSEYIRAINFVNQNSVWNLYVIIDNLINLSKIDVVGVQNVLGIMLAQIDESKYYITYEAVYLKHTPFAAVRLLQSIDRPMKNHLSLIVSSDKKILLSEVINHYGNENFAVASDDTPGNVPTSYIKKIGNYQLVFRSFLGKSNNLYSVAIYSQGERGTGNGERRNFHN